MKKVLPYIFILLLLAGTRACTVHQQQNDELQCRIDKEVRDTLFIYFKDCEDEYCEVTMQEFIGGEYIQDGKVFFDVRGVRTGWHTIWLHIGNKYAKKTFYKK